MKIFPLWRKYIVRDKALLAYCKQDYIKFNTEKDVRLLGQSQSNHYHVELFTYALYCLLKDDNLYDGFSAIGYEDVKSVDYLPYFYLSDSNSTCRLEVAFINNRYVVELIFQEATPQDIVDLFEKTDNSKYKQRFQAENDVLSFLRQINSVLQEKDGD